MVKAESGTVHGVIGFKRILDIARETMEIAGDCNIAEFGSAIGEGLKERLWRASHFVDVDSRIRFNMGYGFGRASTDNRTTTGDWKKAMAGKNIAAASQGTGNGACHGSDVIVRHEN
jgi:hypothetical protein